MRIISRLKSVWQAYKLGKKIRRSGLFTVPYCGESEERYIEKLRLHAEADGRLVYIACRNGDIDIQKNIPECRLNIHLTCNRLMALGDPTLTRLGKEYYYILMNWMARADDCISAKNFYSFGVDPYRDNDLKIMRDLKDRVKAWR
jgi:hypothetical protein